MRYLLVMLFLSLVWMPLVGAEDDIGRLFFTPEQRQHLERLRLDKQQPSDTAAAESDAVLPLLPVLPEQNIQGYVKRNDAKLSTIWLNGKPEQRDANHVPE